MKYIKYFENYSQDQNKLPNDLETQVKKALVGKSNVKDAVLKDKDNNTVYHIKLNKGNIVDIKEIGDINESKIGDYFKRIGNKILNLVLGGAVLLTLAGGTVSCDKEEEEGVTKFSYNLNGKYTEYDPSKGEDNKTYRIPTGNSARPYMDIDVDSTLGKTSDLWGGGGWCFARPLTPTEAMIYRYGQIYEFEKHWFAVAKNGNVSRDLHIQEFPNTEIYYTYHDEGYGYGISYPRSDDTWKNALDYLKNVEGLSDSEIELVIMKCNKELVNKEWYMPSWSELYDGKYALPNVHQLLKTL